MKIWIIPFSLTAILLSVLSCRENNPKAKTPADTQQMEGVRESRERAMDKEASRTTPAYENEVSDSLAKKDSVAMDSMAKDSAGN